MRRRYTIAIAGALPLVPATSSAQLIHDGASLKKRCETFQLFMPSSGLGCRAYVGAIVDVLADGNSINGYRGCPPANEKREKILAALKSWFQENDELGERRASAVTAQALSEIYPCEAQ